MMSSTAENIRVGPIVLADGISRFNFITFFYASFISIGLLTGMSFLQAYILTEHLGIPRPQQGAITGLLGLTAEGIAVPMTALFGIMADRIGRRPVFVFSLMVIGVSYALYPFATSVLELIGYRMIFAIGAASMGAVLATVGADYPAEQSRGKFIGLSNVMGSLGVMFTASGVAQIPAILHARTAMTPIESGRVMFLFCAVLCVLSAIWCRFGLKSGTPAGKKDRLPFRVLLTSGLRAVRNPRLAVSFAAAFTARTDLALKGAFISLWAIQAGVADQISPAIAMARVGIVFAVMQVVAFIWNLVFGVITDRINRVTALALAMGLAGIGYSSMAFVNSPLHYAMLPAFALLSVGSASAITAAAALVGQEAPVKERGAVMGVNQLFAAAGALFTFTVGGWLFDSWQPAPFVLAGVIQIVICAVAIGVRLVAPGPADIGQSASDSRASTGGAATTGVAEIQPAMISGTRS